MKKICMVFNHLNFSDGVSRTAIGIADLLADNGYKVDLIPLYRCDKAILGTLHENVSVRPVFRTYFRGLDKLLALISPRLLYRLAVRDTYDIEIAFQERMATRIIAASANKNARHFAWIHVLFDDLDYSVYKGRFDRIVCVSKGNAEILQKSHPDIGSAAYCYNPIDDSRIKEQALEDTELEKNGSVMTLVSVGRVQAQKGYIRLMNILQRLKEEGFRYEFWLIGDGPDMEEVRAFVKDKALEEVKLLGSRNNPHAFTAKADLFVCSSFYEGYSTACTEACILGVPVLTTDVSGGREIIEEAEAGMVTGLSDEELYEGLKTVLSDPDTVRRWKEKLNETSGRFSYSARASRLLNLFS